MGGILEISVPPSVVVIDLRVPIGVAHELGFKGIKTDPCEAMRVFLCGV